MPSTSPVKLNEIITETRIKPQPQPQTRQEIIMKETLIENQIKVQPQENPRIREANLVPSTPAWCRPVVAPKPLTEIQKQDLLEKQSNSNMQSAIPMHYPENSNPSIRSGYQVSAATGYKYYVK